MDARHLQNCICKPSISTPICKFNPPMNRPSKFWCSLLQTACLIKRPGGKICGLRGVQQISPRRGEGLERQSIKKATTFTAIERLPSILNPNFGCSSLLGWIFHADVLDPTEIVASAATIPANQDSGRGVTLSRAQSPELKRATNTVMCLTPRDSGPLSRHLFNLTVYEQEFGCAEYLHHPALLGLSIIWTHGLTRQGPHALASSGLLRDLTRLRFDIASSTYYYVL
jgi:hypothetical protein